MNEHEQGLRLMVDGIEMDGVISVHDVLQWVAQNNVSQGQKMSIIDMLSYIFNTNVSIEKRTVKPEVGMLIERRNDADGSLHTGVIIDTDVRLAGAGAATFRYVRTDNHTDMRGVKLLHTDGHVWRDVKSGGDVAKS